MKPQPPDPKYQMLDGALPDAVWDLSASALCSRYDATIKATCFGGVNIVLRTPEGNEYIDLTYHVDEAFPKADGVVTMDGGA